MFGKGLFGGMFDFNNDGKMNSFEKAAEFAAFMHIVEETEKDLAKKSAKTSTGTSYTEFDDSDDM